MVATRPVLARLRGARVAPWRRAIAALILVLGAAVTTAGPAQAGPIGAQAQVSTTIVNPGDRPAGNPAAAYDPTNDRFLVVWASEHEKPGTGAIWGRFVLSNGAPNGLQFKIANSGTGADGWPAFNARVAYSSKLKRFFVAFTGFWKDGDASIRYQWLDPQGRAIGGLGSLGPGYNAPHVPQVVPNDMRSGVSVFWQATLTDDPVNRVLGTTVTATGAGPLKRITPANGTYALPAAAAGPGGEIGLAFSVALGSATKGDLGVMRLTADLAPIGGIARALPAGANTTDRPSIAWNPVAAQWIVAWPHGTRSGVELHATRFAPNLTQIGAPLAISQMGPANAPAYGTGPDSSVATDPITGQSAMFWSGDTVDATHADGQFEVWGRTRSKDWDDDAPQSQLSAFGPLPGTASSNYLLTGAVATDTRRGRWLVPFVGKIGGGPLLIYTRLFEPTPPPPPPPPVATPDPCPGQQQFTTRKGAVCGPAPVTEFGVGAVVKSRRVIRMVVAPTSRGQVITVRCVSRCARHKRTASAHPRGKSRTLSTTRVGLKAGSTVEVRVSAGGATMRYRQYRVLSRFPYLSSKTSACRVTAARLRATC
ncbi:MAG: hypothetical protein PGN13_11200 [Patulibacter minatonensis]